MRCYITALLQLLNTKTSSDSPVSRMCTFSIANQRHTFSLAQYIHRFLSLLVFSEALYNWNQQVGHGCYCWLMKEQTRCVCHIWTIDRFWGEIWNLAKNMIYIHNVVWSLCCSGYTCKNKCIYFLQGQGRAIIVIASDGFREDLCCHTLIIMILTL